MAISAFWFAILRFSVRLSVFSYVISYLFWSEIFGYQEQKAIWTSLNLKRKGKKKKEKEEVVCFVTAQSDSINKSLPCLTGSWTSPIPYSQKLLPSLLTFWGSGGVSSSLHSLAPLSSLLKALHLEEKAPSLLSFSKKTYLNVTVSYYPNPFSHRHGHSQTDLLYPFSFLDFFCPVNDDDDDGSSR